MENKYALHRKTFSEIRPILDFMDTGKDLIGNYFIVDWKQGDQCYLITKELLEKDPRWFELDFIEHHNLRIGIKE